MQQHFEGALPHLKQMKQQTDKHAFNETLTRLLPGLRNYIGRRLSRAIRKGLMPKRKYRVNDFVDELYLLAYDHIEQLPSGDELRSWLFEQADQLLDRTISTEEFNKSFMEHVDSYSKLEWEEMQEKFTADADGDLIMEEELDDPSYPKHDYSLEDVFVEDKEKSLLEKLNKELTAEEIHQHIDMVLHQLPLQVQAIFELATQQHFEPEEIARIRNLSVEEVEKHLADARKFIRISFEKRFLLSKI